MKNWHPTITALVNLFSLFLAMGCNRADEAHFPGCDPLQPKPVVSVNISGRVIDEAGTPLAGAQVMVQGELVVTGSDGTFGFPDIEVPGNRCVIRTTKADYFPAIRAITPEKQRYTEASIVLMASHVTHTFQAGTGKRVSVPERWELIIPPNALVLSESGGTSYSGLVNMSLRFLDPASENFRMLLPGGDMVALRKDRSTSRFVSLGILRIQLRDPTGKDLQLAPGLSATLTMSIPEKQLPDPSDTIATWFFDEDRGLWKEGGFSMRRSNQYTATITRLSDWGLAAPCRWPP